MVEEDEFYQVAEAQSDDKTKGKVIEHLVLFMPVQSEKIFSIHPIYRNFWQIYYIFFECARKEQIFLHMSKKSCIFANRKACKAYESIVN